MYISVISSGRTYFNDYYLPTFTKAASAIEIHRNDYGYHDGITCKLIFKSKKLINSAMEQLEKAYTGCHIYNSVLYFIYL